MGKNKKEKKNKSVIPTYVFGITWLVSAILFDWSIVKCLIVAWAAQWLASFFIKDQAKKRAEKGKETSGAKAPTSEKKPEKKPEPAAQEEPKKTGTGNPELDGVIRDGRSSVAKIQQLNDEIPDYKLSAQLKQIEILTASIIDQVERKPDKLKEVRQFMNYYLPTTIRLLEQYVQLQNVGMKGENISEAMNKIESMLENVIVAFQKQLDSLFERDVVDITADIQVMEQMMASQGLTGQNDFQ